MFFGEFREHFAVKPDAGFFELVNQFAVIRDVLVRQLADGRVDFDVPKFAEISFLFSTVAEGMHARVKQCLFCGALF